MKGSCLCGAVAYEVDAAAACRSAMLLPHLPQGACRAVHCHGSRAAREFPLAARRGQAQHLESSPGKNRYFCSVCGSQLIAERPASRM